MNKYPQDVKSYTQWREKFINWESTNKMIREKNHKSSMSDKPDPAFFDHNWLSAMSPEDKKKFLSTRFETTETNKKPKRDGS